MDSPDITASDILCIGSALWDMIGRTERPMPQGADQPGRIERLPGGVALNIAMALRRVGLRPRLLSHIGHDTPGDALMSALADMDIDASLVMRTAQLPTSQYMAIEGPDGLVAAIADAHALEAAGEEILAPLADGRLASAAEPYQGLVAVDGNLTAALLEKIAHSPLFARADLRLAPASPGKAERLAPLMPHPRATLYVNLEEACILSGCTVSTAPDAADALFDAGARRVLVTDGPNNACARTANGAHIAAPPPTTPRRITGAGDTFMAAHIAAELEGKAPDIALTAALRAAATYVAGDTP